MKQYLTAAAVLVCLLLTVPAFGQSSNASLSGTVTDASGAVLPGANIKAVNNATGVTATAVANTAGVYSFPSLQAGIYRVTAELAGFQTQTFTDLQLRGAAQVRLNVTMEVRKLEQQIEVSVSSDDVLLESSSSVGLMLPEKSVTNLPLVNNNVVDLVKVMGGTVIADGVPMLGVDSTVMAGVTAGNINVQRDGITVNDVRYATGINSPVRLNNEMISEFKVVLSPVDAELGRGNGQVQILSKAGGNAYHGSLVWSVQNTALDSNEWFLNKTHTQANYRNMNEYTANIGGPIIKNKTFFFVMWNQQISRQRQSINPPVLTPCARKGIFRWYDNWMSTNALGSESSTGFTPTRRAVDANGTPIAPTTNPNGTPFSGALRLGYVFGQLNPGAITDTINCSDFDPASDVIPGTAYDTYRTQPDTSGFISRFTDMMPAANNYETGDGLNTAGHKWTLRLKGSDNIVGLGEDNLRKQINARIDHNFSKRHRISGNFSYEKSSADDHFASWPNGYGGAIERTPKFFTVSFTSTLRSTMLNEFRFGLSSTDSYSYDPIYNPKTGAKLRALIQTLYPTENLAGYKGLPLHINPGAGVMAFHTDNYTNLGFLLGGFQSNPVGSRGALAPNVGGHDPRWTYSDTVTWTRGKHTFKFGGQLRMSKSLQDRRGRGLYVGDANVYTSVIGGNTPSSQIQGINGTRPGLTGLVGMSPSWGSAAVMANLLNYHAGSVNNLRNYLFVNSPTALSWNDYSAGEDTQTFDIRMKEGDLFFKDDWKVTDNLTLNLGLRYEYYSVPYLESGMTVGLEGGSSAIFGISGRSFDNWLGPNPSTDGELTKQIFVGPNSQHPEMQVYKDDFNNIGPAVGFAYTLPWFGKGKTTLRGGYQISYMPIARAESFAGIIANTIGTSYTNVYTGDSSTPYINLAMLPSLVPAPIPANAIALAPIDIKARNQSYTVYDENLRNPYVQNLTLALVRNIGSNLTLDVRYIGTLTRKALGTVNVNSPNFLGNDLKEAFDAARSGGESALLNQIFHGINYAGSGYGAVGTVFKNVLQTGAMHLRANSNTAGNLSNGNYASVAGTLATANYTTSYSGNSGLPYVPSGVNGSILRYNGFPENFIYTNPQFGTASFTGNLDHSNYHSMQAQATLRPTQGFSFVTTYTWSRNLGVTGSYVNPLDRAADYGLLGGHRTHQLITYGAFDLPFGRNRSLFSDSSRLVDAFIGGWQLSWIGNVTSGNATSITGSNTTLFYHSIPDFVGPEGSFDTKMGKVTWKHGASDGDYFGAKYVKIKDPQCNNVTTLQNLRNTCTLQALALASDPGVIVFQNAYPGTRGNFGRRNVTIPGRWGFDMAMSKMFKAAEGKTIQFRVDATNVFNHPMPSLGQLSATTRTYLPFGPDTSLSGTNRFGLLNSKVGTRSFQAKIRFNF